MNADPIARAYRWIEYAAFGRALERCRWAQLDAIAERRRILLLGEGDGRFLKRLAGLHPRASIDVVEKSLGMIRVAAARLSPAESSRVRFHRSDALLDPLPGGGYDMVVTHFVFDCWSPDAAAAVVRKAAHVVEPGALWLVSEFAEPRSGLARLHAAAWLRVMYLFFRYATGLETTRVPDYENALAANAFVLVGDVRWRMGLVVSQLWRRQD